MTAAAISHPHSGFLQHTYPALSQTSVPAGLPTPRWGNYYPGAIRRKTVIFLWIGLCCMPKFTSQYWLRLWLGAIRQPVPMLTKTCVARCCVAPTYVTWWHRSTLLRLWLVTWQHEDITWANVGKDPGLHMAFLESNEWTCTFILYSYYNESLYSVGCYEYQCSSHHTEKCPVKWSLLFLVMVWYRIDHNHLKKWWFCSFTHLSFTQHKWVLMISQVDVANFIFQILYITKKMNKVNPIIHNPIIHKWLIFNTKVWTICKHSGCRG